MYRNSDRECLKKIFRPWDVDMEQDATISTTTTTTTTTATTPKRIDETPAKTNPPQNKQETNESKSNRRISKTNQRNPANPEYPAAQFDAYPIYPDVLQTNLARSLGLNPTDSMLLESVAQGYAMEEYARIVSQEQQSRLLSGRKQRPKKYKCPHCDVGFSNNGQLKGHIRIHTGERPFRCDEKNCGKTFTRNEELTRHKRIHSGLRPFPCAQCGKRFGRKDHLKKHTRTHLQHRGVYAVPVMFHPVDPWTAAPSAYPYLPVYGY